MGNTSRNNDELIAIAGCNNSTRQGDVVFVHGLGGSARSTWHPYEQKDDNNFWLTWLWQEMPQFGIWSFGYEAEPSQWKGTAMSLFDQASNLLAWVDARELGTKPLFFVTHSMGGLLVKKFLSTAHNFKREALLEQVKGIVFLSTPHTGSHLANLVKNIGVLARTTVSVNELKAHEPQLRELNEWYRENVTGLDIATKVFYETRTTKGISVVDPDSANPGISGVKPIAISKDHINIAKPSSTNDLVFLGVKSFLYKNLKSALEESHKESQTTDLIVSSLDSARRLSPLKGHPTIKLEGEKLKVFTEGFCALFSLTHNQIGSALIRVRGIVLRVLEFIPDKIPKYEYKVDFDQLIGKQTAETRVFNISLDGKNPPISIWVEDSNNPLFSETGNLLDVVPPRTLTLTSAAEDQGEELKMNVVAVTPGFYKLQFVFEYFVLGQDHFKESEIVQVYYHE